MSCLVRHVIRTQNGETISSTVFELRYSKVIKNPSRKDLYELVHFNHKDKETQKEYKISDEDEFRGSRKGFLQ